MTAKQLIAALRKFDPETRVWVQATDAPEGGRLHGVAEVKALGDVIDNDGAYEGDVLIRHDPVV